MSEPLVSVIIPSYDRPLFLRNRSIPSVLRQTYGHWELIVVGDGPEDGSLRRAVESFRDPRIRYTQIERPDYRGLSSREFWHVAGAAARNHGLTLARGDLFCPLDDDDEFLPDHLADCVRAFAEIQIDLAYGCVLVRDLEARTEVEDFFPWNLESTQKRFARRNIMFHSSVCYSRRMAGLRYPLDGDFPADYGLWRQMAAAGARFAGLSKPQSIYYGEKISTLYRVSVPSLPPQAEFENDLRTIFESRTLSNSGPVCKRFERAVSDYVHRDVVATPSGDVGLLLAFAALKERVGDTRKSQIIVPSYTHPSTVNALLWNGFEPLFCDVDAATLCATPETVEPLLDERVAAIVPIHAHGNPCDMPALERLATERNVALVTDASAAFGAKVGGRVVGGFGDIEVFSFSGTKVLTCGEGGMVCCRDPELAETVSRLGRYGISADYVCESRGINGKLAELPAALGLAGLQCLDNWLVNRRRAADRYRRRLEGIPGLKLQRPSTPDSVGSCKDFALILPSAEEAGRLACRLRAYRIDSRPYYRPLHRMPAFARYTQSDLSNTEMLADAVLCIPIYNCIGDELIDLVGTVICDHFATNPPQAPSKHAGR
jgi:dTDP-4-amino-4,6-dideoxygalactose transaminase